MYPVTQAFFLQCSVLYIYSCIHGIDMYAVVSTTRYMSMPCIHFGGTLNTNKQTNKILLFKSVRLSTFLNFKISRDQLADFNLSK